MTNRAVGIELARQRAHEVLHRTPLAKNQPVPIEALAKALGVELIVTRLDGASAQLIEGPHSASILLSDRLTDAADRRWAIAHELGHLLLDHPAPPAAELCRPRPHPHPQMAKQRDSEAESDAFASALLIRPEAISEIRDVRPMTLGAPALLAERCRVPLTAAAIRITEESLRSCAAVLSERGTIRWVSPSWRFFTRYGAPLAPGQPIPSSSTAQHYSDRSAIPWEPCISGRNAWIERPSWVLVFEHSMPTSEPDTVLTMLWSLDELTTTASDPQLHRTPKFVRDCLLDMLRAAEEIRRSRKELIDIAAQPPVPGDTTWYIGPDGSYARPGFLRLR